MRWSPVPGLLLLGVLAAQTPPVPSPQPAPVPPSTDATNGEPLPAITLLLQSERRLDAGRLRRRWARLTEQKVASEPAAEGAFVAAADDQIVGGRDGLRWRLVVEPRPHPLPDAAVAHLDDEQRGLLRTHTMQLVVRAEAAPADAAARDRCYQVLAGVAAALLGRDVLGIGAAAHGTFDAFDGDVETLAAALLDDEPLVALAPEQATSLVAFLSAVRELEQTAVEQALGAEFGVPFTEPPEGSEATHLVIVQDGTAIVFVDGEVVIVNCGGPNNPTPAELEQYQDLRIRHLLGEHRQLLRVLTRGAVGEVAESARRRLCARVVAALWGDDVLGLSWHCDRRLVPTADATRQQLRAADPVAATLGDPLVPVLVPRDESAMQKAIEQARASWAEAVAHHQKGGEVTAKFRFATRSGNFEHIWVTVQKIDGEQVSGVLANHPRDLGDWKLGTAVTAKLTELSDWLFERDGKMVGGFTVKVLQAEAAEAAKQPPAPKGGK